MAKSIKSLREFYSFLLGENLVKKLSNEQISLLSKYYGSLTTKEKNKIDDAISKGKSHDLLEMAQTLIEESNQDKKPQNPTIKKTKVKIPNKKENLPSSSTEKKEKYTSLKGKRLEKISPQKIISESTLKLSKPKKDPILGNSIIIKKSLLNIVSLIETQNKINSNNYDKERKKKEREDRRKKESNLEKIKVAGIAAIKKVISPVRDILDKIINFLTWVILGRSIIKFLNWTSDPKNKSKLEALGNFLKNWWPTILGAFVLFATPLGKFIRVVVGTITKFTFQLLKKGIPALQRLIKQKNKTKVTDDSQRRRRNAKVTQANRPSKFRGGRGGLAGTLAFLGLEAMAPMLGEQVGNFYRSKGIGTSGLSDDELLKQYNKEKSNFDKMKSGPLGGLLSQRMDQSRLDSLEEELEYRGLAYKSGGEIFSGMVNNYTGLKVSGAGRDTQAFQVLGGGSAVLEPGELVLNKEQQKNIQMDTGIDPRSYVSDARPKQVSGNIKGYNTGGVIGMKSPKINASDYNALLAISALEDDKPQGRSDVAQSLYNRMLAAQKYRVNFNQTSNSLKDLITAPQQYEPTFSNRNDWINIRDRNSAAFAIMNSAKGRKYKWNLKDALKQLSDTESALKNPSLQSRSQKHVGGRSYFLGTSQHANMKSGDVLRDPTSNFFSPWYLEGTPYDKQRRNIAAPIPEMLLPKKSESKPKSKTKPLTMMDRLGKFANQVGSGIAGLLNSGKGALAKPIKRQGGGLIPQGPFTPLPHSGYVRPQGSFIPKPMLSLPGPLPGTTVPFGYDPFRGLIGGGLVTGRTGMSLLGKNSGVTADTELTLLQRGEYVLTRDFVNRVGESSLDKLVAYFDSNSNPAKLGNKNVNRTIPGPRKRNGNMNIKTLPALNSSSQMPSSQTKPGSDVPFFPMEPSSSISKRSEQMAIYGIIG